MLVMIIENNICHLLNIYFALIILHVVCIIYLTTYHVNIIFYLFHKMQSFSDFPKVT